MSSYWVNFAKSGDPNGKGLNGIQLDKWPAYDGKNQSVMVFGNPPRVRSRRMRRTLRSSNRISIS